MTKIEVCGWILNFFFHIVWYKINMKSTYHPETNGQIKRLDRNLEDMLRMGIDNGLGISGYI